MNIDTPKKNKFLHHADPKFVHESFAMGVAKHCAVLTDKADRELIWFIHSLSCQDGGLAAVATKLIRSYSHRLGTRSMIAIGKPISQKYTTAEVVKIRFEIPKLLREKFPLRGETNNAITSRATTLHLHAEHARMRLNSCHPTHEEARTCNRWIRESKEAAAMQLADAELAQTHPASYTVETFLTLCRQSAENGIENESRTSDLEKELARLCLDLTRDLKESGPWYFFDLPNVLRKFHRQWIQNKSNVVVTALGKKVCDMLDYTLQTRSLTLLEGNARMGKSFSARAWCEQHPGKARFVEVPGGNDDASFLRALARGLGLGKFLNYKLAEIRECVEAILRSGDIILVLDEAQRLWPQRIRFSFPSRITWVMALANDRVPICLVSTPQFLLAQKVIEKSGWNSAQFTGRLGGYDFLPGELEAADLMAVSRSVLPEASEKVLKAMAIYAKASARYLAAVDTIAKRAKYIALRDGRSNCSTQDIRAAMNESVIPSDTMLARTLEQAKNYSDRRTGKQAGAPALIPPARMNKLPSEIGTIMPGRAGGVFDLVQG